MFDSEPFGQRAVRLGLVTSAQVREALETQRMLAERAGLLGEILVDMGWLDPIGYIEIVQDLMEKNGQESHDDVQAAFVQRALDSGRVTDAQVEQAKAIQAGWSRKNKLIGQVMVEMGFLTSEDLEKILSTYRNGD